MNSKNEKNALNKGINKESFNAHNNSVLAELSDRSRDIIKLRYGIGQENSKTLEEIGRKYNITRERIRQILKEVFHKMEKNADSEILSIVREKITFTVREKSGIIKEQELIELLSFGDKKDRGAVRFFLDLLDDIRIEEKEKELEKSYAFSDFILENWQKIKNDVKAILERIGHPLHGNDLYQELTKLNANITHKKLFDYLAVAEEIKRNNFGKWGLASWMEINPKGTREKIYLVLKEKGAPLHFREIAKAIDENKLSIKKAHPQTVHNELIRDERFILVGRGTYALSEWGYKKGTVKEVLEDIMKKNSKPMKKEEIMSEIMRHRQVKKTTVVINLNNYFMKVGKDLYSVKK